MPGNLITQVEAKCTGDTDTLSTLDLAQESVHSAISVTLYIQLDAYYTGNIVAKYTLNTKRNTNKH